MEVIGQWSLNKIRGHLILGIMFIYNGGDADAAGRGVELVHIVEIYIIVYGAL